MVKAKPGQIREVYNKWRTQPAKNKILFVLSGIMFALIMCFGLSLAIFITIYDKTTGGTKHE
jgi:hypothetical protein